MMRVDFDKWLKAGKPYRRRKSYGSLIDRRQTEFTIAVWCFGLFLGGVFFAWLFGGAG